MLADASCWSFGPTQDLPVSKHRSKATFGKADPNRPHEDGCVAGSAEVRCAFERGDRLAAMTHSKLASAARWTITRRQDDQQRKP
jgi:hypothetical protein